MKYSREYYPEIILHKVRETAREGGRRRERERRKKEREKGREREKRERERWNGIAVALW